MQRFNQHLQVLQSRSHPTSPPSISHIPQASNFEFSIRSGYSQPNPYLSTPPYIDRIQLQAQIDVMFGEFFQGIMNQVKEEVNLNLATSQLLDNSQDHTLCDSLLSTEDVHLYASFQAEGSHECCYHMSRAFSVDPKFLKTKAPLCPLAASQHLEVLGSYASQSARPSLAIPIDCGSLPNVRTGPHV